METKTRVCVACDRGSDVVPLLNLDYAGSTFSICPQHLPFLIHDPAKLIGRLPGAEKFQPSPHED